ncbi:MAG TPA: hypothetical protein VFL85_01640 [Candidatus Saccharimonadales bacterium]|nr:hypothetical protein [Candidatus Saccharimonadales bacterium]
MEDWQKRRVKKVKQIHGEDHYRRAGAKGGRVSPTKFKSDSARDAVNARWAKWREQKAKEEKEQNEHGEHL